MTGGCEVDDRKPPVTKTAIITRVYPNTLSVRATVLQVRLLLEPRSFTLRLADNDSELPTATSAKANNRPERDLVNMRQRLERLKNVLRVLNQPKHSVTVEMSLSPAAFRAGGEGTKNKH